MVDEDCGSQLQDSLPNGAPCLKRRGLSQFFVDGEWRWGLDHTPDFPKATIDGTWKDWGRANDLTNE